MILNYKTDRLPSNFIFLGLFLLIVGVWRVLLADWFGIILLVISFLCLFTRWGVLLDSDKKRLKQYIGFFGIKKGNWKDIGSLKHIEVTNLEETQNMGVASISRSDIKIVYKLFLVLPDENIEIMKGKNDFIIKAAEEISSEFKTNLINESS
jgi:hypothetical protein